MPSNVITNSFLRNLFICNSKTQYFRNHTKNLGNVTIPPKFVLLHWIYKPFNKRTAKKVLLHCYIICNNSCFHKVWRALAITWEESKLSKYVKILKCTKSPEVHSHQSLKSKLPVSGLHCANWVLGDEESRWHHICLQSNGKQRVARWCLAPVSNDWQAS